MIYWFEWKGTRSTAKGIRLQEMPEIIRPEERVALSVLPLMKLIAAKMRSAASWVMWGFIFITFFLLREIADEMTVIAFFGLIGNLFGAILFKLAKRGEGDG